MKKLLLVVFLLLSLTLLAERYIIDSKGGYANFREGATTNSKIIEKLKNDDEVILWRKEGNWYLVGAGIDGERKYIEGYIHKSQLKLHPETYITFSESENDYVDMKWKLSDNKTSKLAKNIYVTKQGEEGDWYYIEFTECNVVHAYVPKSQLKKYVGQK